MGGRKKSSRKPVAKKSLPPLETSFMCPFCNNDQVVSVTMYAAAAASAPPCPKVRC